MDKESEKKPFDIIRLCWILLIVGITFTIAAPYLFTRNWSDINFNGYGDIGDTIGGITAPITSLIGSILVFFALKAQIDANKIIQTQIDKQTTDEVQKRNSQHISELYQYFLKSIDDFTMMENQPLLENRRANTFRNELITYHGIDAMAKFIARVYSSPNDCPSDEIFDFYLAREFYGTLSVGNDLIDNINSANIHKSDKEFFMKLMIHQFRYRIFPFFDTDNGDVEPCTVCGKMHGNLPLRIYSLVQEIKRKINN